MKPTMEPLSADGGTKPGQDVGPKGPKGVGDDELRDGEDLFDEIAAESLTGGADPTPSSDPKGDKGLAGEGHPVLFDGGSDPDPNDTSKGDKGL